MKLEARNIKVGDIILIPQVKAKVISISNGDTLLPNISENHSILVFDTYCETGPFRKTTGRCTAIGTDKLNVIKRVSNWEHFKKWFSSLIYRGSSNNEVQAKATPVS